MRPHSSRSESFHTCSGSLTAQGLPATCHFVAANVAFHVHQRVGTLISYVFAAPFPACVCPCQRFTDNLTIGGA